MFEMVLIITNRLVSDVLVTVQSTIPTVPAQ